MGAQELAILRAIEERLTAIEAQIAARSAPAEQIAQALHDILDIYNNTGQMREVVSGQRDQMQAFAEAMQRFHELFSGHERREMALWEDIAALMVQLRELARKQVRQFEDLERELGKSQEERAAWRDARPEER